ncbi:YkgJ family cysteine cluster protein [Streptomyces iconiensis]|uniref:YkgJ family cysteine cluster protein n=1 Tax=Streptomyces iconiensis TaxID=1384038 RepID=A0ABT7A0P2_9ACTN|nr:hypothetical protein [Streptomyces iconiensis]MDJ1134902.1 hypothetical protein [Streptomyces iconiensis]
MAELSDATELTEPTGATGATADSTPGVDGQWQSSRAKGLCYRGPRVVTGADIVRISRTLALEPWHFTQTAPAAANDPTGVVLDNARRRVNVRIANAAHGCVFHILTSEGTGRCGLGELAPLSCRMFPTVPGRGTGHDGAPGPEEDGEGNGEENGAGDEAAGGDHGGPGAPGRPLDAAGLAWAERRWAADRDQWFETVARWNALAEDADEPPGVEDFQRYLLEAHAAREAGAPWPEEVVA